MTDADAAPEEPKKKRKRGIFTRILKYFSLLILLFLIGTGGFAYWVCATESGQAWLLKTANAALAPREGEPGLAIKLTSLSGTLPFNFATGVEIADARGVWLTVPEIAFSLNWRKLPGELVLEKLEILGADFSRFPQMPPSPPEPPSPFGIGDLKRLLAQAGDFLKTPHWWLPEIQLQSIALKNARLPADIAPQKEPGKRIGANLTLSASLAEGKLQAAASADAANADSTPLDFGQFSAEGLGLSLNLAGAPENSGINVALDAEAEVKVPVLTLSELPENFLGDKATLGLRLEGNAGAENAALRLTGPGLAAGDASLSLEGDWQSGDAWGRDELDGPLNLNVQAKILPPEAAGGDSPLAVIKAPVALDIVAKGDLPALSLAVNLDCPALSYQNHNIADLKLSLASPEVAIPLSEAGLTELANENVITTRLEGKLEKEPLLFSGDVFLQALKNPAQNIGEETIWRLGVRDLTLEGLGLNCGGAVAALVPPGKKPLLDGSLKFSIRDWRGIAAFVPDYRFAGKVDLDAHLVSGIANDPAAKLETLAPQTLKTARQDAKLTLNAAGMDVKGVSGRDSYAVGNLRLVASATDIYGELALDADLAAQKIRAAGFGLNAKATVKGGVKGPLDFSLAADGDANANIAGVWQPGKVRLAKLHAEIGAPRFLPDSKKGSRLGLDMAAPVEFTYGDGGLGISGLDARITPSGRLRANGGLSPSKLDLAIELENVDFKPWQALVPQIPSGGANLSLKLSGTPSLPGGSFTARLSKVKVPNTPLAPVSVALAGALWHGQGGSVFDLKLDVDTSTLKTLGATTARVSAAIPLLFDAKGIPQLNKGGALAAKVVWDGALGPIWNLVPVADQRLNGRININLDAAGTLERPRIRGGIRVEKARYENILLGILLTDMNLDIQLTDKGAPRVVAGAALPGGMSIAASISDGHRGSVKINGGGDLDGENLDVKINIDKLKPLRRRDIHVELSGALAVAGSAFSPIVSGEVIVNRGEVLLDNIAMTGSVTTLDITQVSAKNSPPPKAQGAGMGKLDIRIRMLPRFRVDGRGLGSLWEANLLVAGSLNNPQITGSINAVSGNFDFLGKMFELAKGTVTFAGGSLSNPFLDIQLVNETPDLTAKIMILGPVDKMHLFLTSDPSIPRDEILSRVLFGKSVGDLSRLEALQLAAAVAQLAGFGSGGGIFSFTKKALGLDVLRIGTSSSDNVGDDESGAAGTTLEAGKYITDKLYMGVQQGMKADSTAFIIQFELTPRTSLEVRSEQNNTWGGLNWKYNY